MLIDIEKYVNQMLPPNKRLPVHLGLATTLFSPINRIINASNRFEYDNQFDLGTPGQVAVLEYILQSYVDGNIRVADATGGLIDFRVLVPQSLSAQSRGEVVRLIERYRLRSKRYEIVDSISWGGGGIPVVPLAWAFGPVVNLSESGGYIIRMAVSKAGTFRTILKHGNEVALDAYREYAAGQVLSFPVSTGSNWYIQVDDLSALINPELTETTEKPDYLLTLAFTFNADTHEFTLWVNATKNIASRIAPTSGAAASGSGWDNNTWVAGTTEYTGEDFSELYRYNPVTLGNGGILPNTEYFIYLRDENDPFQVFVKTFTTPNVSNAYPPQTIPLVVDGIGKCERGPTLANTLQEVAKDHIIYRFDGSKVFSIKNRIRRKADNVEVRYRNIDPQSETVTFNFEELEPGDYWLEIEGNSCSSLVSRREFTITSGGGGSTPLAFSSGSPFLAGSTLRIAVTKTGTFNTVVRNRDTGQFLYNAAFAYVKDESLVIPNLPVGTYDIDVDSLHTQVTYTPPVVDPNNIVPKVMTDSLKSDLNLEWSGSSENWTVIDISTYAAPANHRFRYRAGGSIIDGAQLVNFVWQSNEPCRIVKCTVRNGFPDTGPWGGGQADQGDPTVSAGMTNGSSSYAYSLTMFQPQ